MHLNKKISAWASHKMPSTNVKHIKAIVKEGDFLDYEIMPESQLNLIISLQELVNSSVLSIEKGNELLNLIQEFVDDSIVINSDINL